MHKPPYPLEDFEAVAQVGDLVSFGQTVGIIIGIRHGLNSRYYRISWPNGTTIHTEKEVGYMLESIKEKANR